MTTAFDQLAAMASVDPAFLGAALVRARTALGVSDDAVAALLGMNPAHLSALMLCLTPRPHCYAADITGLAERFGIDPERLAGALALGGMPA